MSDTSAFKAAELMKVTFANEKMAPIASGWASNMVPKVVISGTSDPPKSAMGVTAITLAFPLWGWPVKGASGIGKPPSAKGYVGWRERCDYRPYALFERYVNQKKTA